MAQIIQPVRGTVDYYPEKMALRTWLYAQMRSVSEAFGYQEFDGPFLERIELYEAKSGAELVEKQSYVFDDRKGDRIALRPELTPSLARLVATRQRQLTYPLRWWSFGPFWRYEKPQKGRTREFFQWNIDLIGDSSPEADAELATIAASFLKKIGLAPDETKILVNNRELMQIEIESLGISSTLLGGIYNLIDRRDRLDASKWEQRAADLGLDAEQIKGLIKLLSNKDLWKKSTSLQRFFQAVEASNAQEYVQFAPHIIRGLDYYTGTVFEAWDTAGNFRSLFGGGRYDDLVNAVGGDPVPAVGFAAGNVVVSLLLEKLGHSPELNANPAPIYITLFDEDSLLSSLKLAAELRQSGLNVTSHLNADKLQKQLRQANRLAAKVVLIMGPDEIARKEVAVKDLDSGDQRSVPRTELAQHIHSLLESPQAP